MAFKIKETGFYLTRNGELFRVFAELPPWNAYDWVAEDGDGNVETYKGNGKSSIQVEEVNDIVSYLPTVKSWDDPIPPLEPPELPDHLQHTDPPQFRTIQHGEISHDGWIVQRKPLTPEVYTEWLSVGKECGRAWTGWTKGDVKPCYAVAKLRTVEVPANG